MQKFAWLQRAGRGQHLTAGTCAQTTGKDIPAALFGELATALGMGKVTKAYSPPVWHQGFNTGVESTDVMLQFEGKPTQLGFGEWPMVLELPPESDFPGYVATYLLYVNDYDLPGRCPKCRRKYSITKREEGQFNGKHDCPQAGAQHNPAHTLARNPTNFTRSSAHGCARTTERSPARGTARSPACNQVGSTPEGEPPDHRCRRDQGQEVVAQAQDGPIQGEPHQAWHPGVLRVPEAEGRRPSSSANSHAQLRTCTHTNDA